MEANPQKRVIKEAAVDQLVEKQILYLANIRGGTLSIVETAFYNKLTLKTVERALESFVSRGYAEIKVSEEGAVLYHFLGIISEQEKKSARSLQDLL